MTDMTPEHALQKLLATAEGNPFCPVGHLVEHGLGGADALRAALSRPAVPETLAKWASNPEEDDGIGWKQGYEAARRWVAMQLSWRSDLTSVVNASSATEPAEQHPDDAAVDRFAQAMKAKLAQARAKGRSGWDDPAQCSPEYLADLLAGHVRKGNDGNFVDVANFAMMLHQRGAAPSVMPDAIRRSAAEESLTTEQPEGESVAAPQRESVTVRYDLSPAQTESAIRDALIRMGWTPPEGESVATVKAERDVLQRENAELRERVRELEADAARYHFLRSHADTEWHDNDYIIRLRDIPVLVATDDIDPVIDTVSAAMREGKS